MFEIAKPVNKNGDSDGFECRTFDPERDMMAKTSSPGFENYSQREMNH